MQPKLALTYDDVLLVPKRSDVKSRKEVSTEVHLTPKIKLQVPIVSANMDTVTESAMAIAMAKLGGIGIIHRFMTVEEEAREVEKVKRWANYVIEDPHTVTDNDMVKAVKAIMDKHNTGGIVVVSSDNEPVGIVTSRDTLYEESNQPVTQIMTPKEKLITAPLGTDMEKAREILHEHRIEKLPLVDKNGKLAALITLKDIEKNELFPNATKDEKGRLQVGAAIGVGKDFMDRAQALVKMGVDVLVLDIAHGHLEISINTLRRLRSELPETEVIAGNIATHDGAKDLVEAGASAVKVGVGPGSTCTTRVVTGCGVPQLTAVMEASSYCQKNQTPIIADGGIKVPGDVTKALAGGASTVMMGGLLAGTRESPGFPVIRNGRKYKIVRGMASLGANVGRDKREKNNRDDNEYSEYVTEGVEALSPYKGSVTEVIGQFIGGLKSGMSYCGAKTVPELWEKAEFVRITKNGIRESKPHDVESV